MRTAGGCATITLDGTGLAPGAAETRSSASGCPVTQATGRRVHSVKAVAIVVVFTWWVLVNLSPVLGPFGTNSQCSYAAAAYAKAHNVVTTCRRED
jgi:hypothetical protein